MTGSPANVATLTRPERLTVTPPLRYASTHNTATSKVLVTQAGRLYAARLVAKDPAGATTGVGCALYDMASDPGATPADALYVLGLQAGPNAGPDDWPQIPLSIVFKQGLAAKFTTGDAVVSIYWEKA